ncbi:MAG: glycoside hydrolase family 3 C-terminal domain-containing protein [Candidatus Enterosoma sp.]|nr:glycoside hydrolase family 3 C-terminal domain-containing protein [bacterium]MDY3211116.1 glycoside hydrolase family 3 C-terminal domain-containing protein [Candidatus Enterosoma sp.]
MLKKIQTISKICTNVFGVLLGVTLAGSQILLDNAGNITAFLGQSSQEKIENPDAEDEDTLYYTSDFESIEELKENAMNLTSKVTEEGSVLLKNKNNALPLTKGAKVNLYSSSSVNYIYSGGGSSFAKKSDFIPLKDGLEESGFIVNSDLWSWYQTNTQYFGDHTTNTSSDAAKYTINDAKWSEITTDKKNDAAEAGIFVLSRYGTEATDLTAVGGSKTDYSNGNYLELSPKEIDVLKNLKQLKASGKIQKIIVLLNSVNPVQAEYIDDPEYDIDAVLWVGEGGTSTTLGIGKILSGEVNPSGKLTDTYYKKHCYNPIYANFGSYENLGPVVSSANGGKSNRYVVYQEGIYSGYRYTETRYEDIVLNTPNAGSFSYDDVVSYPFGFGLSYSTFDYSDMNVSYNELDDSYQVSIKVTNTGSVKGKESVQIYAQQPYTQYDIDNHIEKSAVDFVGYGKTKMLNPGDSETLSITVDGRWLTSYDSYRAKTYIQDQGTYYLTAGKNAHDACDNILAAKNNKGISVSTDKMSSSGNASLVYSFEKQFDDKKYSHSKVTGKEITNQFDNADLNLYQNRGENSVTYLSRHDWDNTVKFGFTESQTKLNNHVVVRTNENMVRDALKGSETIEKDNIPYPTFGADNGMTLASLLSRDVEGNLMHVDYDDEKWDDLLDQITWEDMVYLLSNGLRKTSGIDSISKPETIDGNGALGPVGGSNYKYSDNENVAEYRYTFLYDDPDQDSSPIQYPCAALIAATLNDELVEKLGESIGEDCLWAGYSGLYGLGVNVHRGSYNGRAFEYYGEDGTLSGKIAASQVKGIHKKGVYVYMKHAILNEQEKNREGVNTWANEQSIRQIYLRSFQIAIEDADAENVMTGFNRIGLVWTSQQGFINTVLRDEFNMSGFAVSDYWQSGYMDLVGGIMGGCALPDGDTASTAEKSALNKYKTGYGALANAMREETHRILYVVINSNAMNGISSGTTYRSVTPPWIKVLNGVKISVVSTSCVIFAAFVGLTITVEVLALKKKEN